MCNCNENIMSGCKDYSLKTANTGIAAISSANPNLNGTNSTTVVTAAQLGTVIRSITIKATQPVTSGMVRLFISDGNTTALYKEVPIPVTPVLESTPTPAPVLPMFEMTLMGNLELKTGYSLTASTQTANSFVIIAEGLDWEYPVQLPSDCCNFKQVSAITGVGIISTANTNVDGSSGTKVNILTAPAQNSNGTQVKTLTIKALQNTSINGMIRLYLSPDNGVTYRLMREIPIPETSQSAYEPSYKQVVDLNFSLEPGYVIAASTQNAESFALTIEGDEWRYPI